jgi:hypothetical protein
MARKEKDTRRIPGYQVQSEPRTSPPEGKGPVHTEPVRWYIEAEGVWTSDRKRARAWPGPSEALRVIREFRARVYDVELHLVPIDGLLKETPIKG